jgi:hypothetical protein
MISIGYTSQRLSFFNAIESSQTRIYNLNVLLKILKLVVIK